MNSYFPFCIGRKCFRPVRPIDCLSPANYHPGMSKSVIIEEQEMTPELARLFEQARRNLDWFDEHAEALGVFKLYRGRFVAASGGELFVGESRAEVERLARERHPDEMPHIRYIPREKRYRIYAC